MSTTNSNGSSSPEQIQADIERQREQLADTVDALGHKLDVKAQAQAKVHRMTDRATTDSGKPRPDLAVAGVLVVAGVVALVWWRKRR